MIHDEMRRMFDTVLTPAPPDTTDIDAALRAGHRRRRSRPAMVLASAAAVLVAAGIVVAGLQPAASPPPSSVGGPEAAATPSADDGAPVGSASELLGVWQTMQLYGEDVTGARDIDGQPLFASFGEDREGQLRWGANDGCNETTGRLTITSDGGFSAAPGGAVAYRVCIEGTQYPQNPQAVQAAQQARIIPAADGQPRQLLLISGGRVLAAYADQSAAATPSADDGEPVGSASELLGVWQTMQLYGEDVAGARDIDGQPLFASFGDDGDGQLWWGANDGCNNTSGLLTITSDGGFSAAPGGTTLRGCLPDAPQYPQNPEAVLSAQQARIIPAADGQPRQLLLIREGAMLAVYAYQSATATPSADDGEPVGSASELLGVWQTMQLHGEDVTGARDADGLPLFARFGDDGQLWWGANDGCNNTSGLLTITSDGGFSAEPGVTTARACIEGTRYPQNPDAVVSAQQARIIPAADGQERRLLLTSVGRVLAVYVYQSDANPAP